MRFIASSACWVHAVIFMVAFPISTGKVCAWFLHFWHCWLFCFMVCCLFCGVLCFVAKLLGKVFIKSTPMELDVCLIVFCFLGIGVGVWFFLCFLYVCLVLLFRGLCLFHFPCFVVCLDLVCVALVDVLWVWAVGVLLEEYEPAVLGFECVAVSVGEFVFFLYVECFSV